MTTEELTSRIEGNHVDVTIRFSNLLFALHIDLQAAIAGLYTDKGQIPVCHIGTHFDDAIQIPDDDVDADCLTTLIALSKRCCDCCLGDKASEFNDIYPAVKAVHAFLFMEFVRLTPHVEQNFSHPIAPEDEPNVSIEHLTEGFCEKVNWAAFAANQFKDFGYETDRWFHYIKANMVVGPDDSILKKNDPEPKTGSTYYIFDDERETRIWEKICDLFRGYSLNELLNRVGGKKEKSRATLHKFIDESLLVKNQKGKYVPASEYNGLSPELAHKKYQAECKKRNEIDQ